tara:strand:+ start:8390 stop:8851 length:462 start_codon:yes stop_codon:yes gene_type:complete
MNSDTEIKSELYHQCQRVLENRLKTVQNSIMEIQQSLQSETKSSAGDKHETGRAMLQLEREKAGNQLAEVLKIKEQFSKVNPEKTSNIISLGSVVFTSENNYFIAISAGKIKAGDTIFYAISPNTPVGQILLSKTIGNTIVFRALKFKITNVI